MLTSIGLVLVGAGGLLLWSAVTGADALAEISAALGVGGSTLTTAGADTVGKRITTIPKADSDQ